MATRVLHTPTQQSSGAATVALVSAVLGYLMLFSGHPFWGFLFEVAAVLLGVIGIARATSPRTGGGLASTIALILAVIGLLLALLGMLGAILF